jgi:anaerobic magnesium-protoporphyrin IX monomethyl ester cyclase
MKITLLHPPLDDPTMPYHSIAHLCGHLRHNGFQDVSMRDVNIEFVSYCLEEENVRAFHAEAERRLRGFNRTAELNLLQQLEFLEIWASEPSQAEELRRAVQRLRSSDGFLDYPRYVASVRLLNRYLGFLGALCYPAGFRNFKHVARVNYCIENLQDFFNPHLAEKACSCFARFFEERLVRDPDFASSDCFGISAIYDHQLVHSLWLARALKRQWPEKLVLFGGTAISQYYKYMVDKSQMGRFFDACDAIVVGEGETALCEIAAGGKEIAGGASIPNTITYDRARNRVSLPARIHYEDLTQMGAPVYEFQWPLYLSPERGISYAPTRGCYWNRCTFCDYGLNSDKPTSPWRERKIEQVIADLQSAIDKQKVSYVYLAVDVMAPGYLERLSDAIIDAELNIHWSAEVRMEKIFSLDRCRKLAKSGCVCISFGMESGNQRVLDLIDKGTKVTYMAETMRNFSAADIAVQLMTFSGFPTETAVEKKATLDFIDTNREYWSAGGMGEFLLTGTAIVARKPELFGIKILETKNMDVARRVNYCVGDSAKPPVMATEDYDASFDGDGGIFPTTLGRPWAGGTDTLHSMIYYSACGKSFFKDHPLDTSVVGIDGEKPDVLDCTLRLAGRVTKSGFDIGQILRNRRKQRGQIKRLMEQGIERTYSDLCQWQSTIQPVTNSKAEDDYWIATGDKCMKIDSPMCEILVTAAAAGQTIREVMASLKKDDQRRLVVCLKQLEASGLVVCFHRDHAVRPNYDGAGYKSRPSEAAVLSSAQPPAFARSAL